VPLNCSQSVSNRLTLFFARGISSSLKMEERRSSETSVHNEPTQGATSQKTAFLTRSFFRLSRLVCAPFLLCFLLRATTKAEFAESEKFGAHETKGDGTRTHSLATALFTLKQRSACDEFPSSHGGTRRGAKLEFCLPRPDIGTPSLPLPELPDILTSVEVTSQHNLRRMENFAGNKFNVPILLQYYHYFYCYYYGGEGRHTVA
jgi:hypothetical protein